MPAGASTCHTPVRISSMATAAPGQPVVTAPAAPAGAGGLPHRFARSRACTPPGQEEPVPHRGHRQGVPDAVERERLRASVGAALRHARIQAGRSQRTLAALAGCDRRTVQRLEAGGLRPTEALLAALAHALTVPPGWSPAGRRAATAVLLVELEAAAGPSLVLASGRRARWRRRRHRTAYRAASRSALPMLRVRAASGGQVATMLHEAAQMVQAAERLLP